MKLGLEEKCALVTGGTKGIGRAVVEALLEEGARVFAVARSAEELLRMERDLASKRLVTARGDVTGEREPARLIQEATEAMGGLDILVANAGRAHPGSFESLTEENWRADLDVKLFHQMRFARAALGAMRRRGGGRIVNVNAVFGRQIEPRFFATTVNRAACAAFTRALAKEVAKDGILVNAVNIGFVESGQWEGRPGVEEAMLSQYPVPLGRFGRAREAADAIVFLVSERASYITGTSIEVDGGLASYL